MGSGHAPRAHPTHGKPRQHRGRHRSRTYLCHPRRRLALPSDPATTVASTPIPTSTITPAMLADPTSNVALGASTAASVWAQGRWSALTQRPSS